MKLVILTCVYNDWVSCRELLPLLDAELNRAGLSADLLLVDDGSTQAQPQSLIPESPKALGQINVLELRKNMGSQRAIAVGLCHVFENLPCDAIIVMDADGEDRPEDVARLVQKLRSEHAPSIVFAERTKRSETLLFTFFYHVYRLLHLLLTGRGIRVGNFSIVPYALLGGLVIDMNLWNHYAASVWMSQVRRSTVPSTRGKRLHGRSKLGFTALVVHGLSAISCYSEIISVRLLFCSSIVLLFLLAAVVAAVAVRVFTNLAIPGWTTYTVGILIVIVLQIVLLSMI
ncbi:MAG: glycosyltransferase, partial [Terriglobia bacterium]